MKNEGESVKKYIYKKKRRCVKNNEINKSVSEMFQTVTVTRETSDVCVRAVVEKTVKVELFWPPAGHWEELSQNLLSYTPLFLHLEQGFIVVILPYKI